VVKGHLLGRAQALLTGKIRVGYGAVVDEELVARKVRGDVSRVPPIVNFGGLRLLVER
jgi:hypothetical protein